MEKIVGGGDRTNELNFFQTIKSSAGIVKRFISGRRQDPLGSDLEVHVNSTRSSTTVVGDHLRNTRHSLDIFSSSIVVRENDTFKRRIREAIEIHCQTPTLNRGIGYQLKAIYRDVLSRNILST